MSSLFKQISQEAAQQRSQVNGLPHPPTPPAILEPATAKHDLSESTPVTASSAKPKAEKVAPQYGTTAPQTGTTSPRLDMAKLKILIQELSELPTNSNGLNVRMSKQEMQDLEDFVFVTLRKEGLKGNSVSLAKLMRYALRYLFRVHEKEFVTALKQSLRVEETLSI